MRKKQKKGKLSQHKSFVASLHFIYPTVRMQKLWCVTTVNIVKLCSFKNRTRGLLESTQSSMKMFSRVNSALYIKKLLIDDEGNDPGRRE